VGNTFPTNKSSEIKDEITVKKLSGTLIYSKIDFSNPLFMVWLIRNVFVFVLFL
jgi:hypothetical protein